MARNQAENSFILNSSFIITICREVDIFLVFIPLAENKVEVFSNASDYFDLCVCMCFELSVINSFFC